MLLHKGNVKRLLCVLLACTLMIAPVTPASASTARATTMKLEKKEGTVTLKTQSGTSLRITNGMRLYNGNSLSTGKSSYAYISLDSSKAVKLDQNSSATLRQSGSNLELLTKSGKLFFNVSKPLTKKESMNVRTSTMVTGIRGTCGVVEAATQTQSKLYLIEGKVTLGSGDQAVTVNGGQVATIVKGAQQPVRVEKMTEKDIPAVALQEIMNDTALQEKIEQTTDLEIEKIREAFEQFQKEEADGNDPGKTDQDQKDDQKEDTKNDDKKDENTSGSSSGGSSGGSSTPSQPSSKEVVLTGTVTSGAIEAAFRESELVHIGFGTGQTGTLSLQEGETLAVPGGKRLHIWGNQSIPGTATIKVLSGGLLCVPENASLTGGSVDLQMAAGSRLEAHGRLVLNNLSSDGTAMIINNDQMILNGAYTSKGSDAYYPSDRAVLISREKSTGLADRQILMAACCVQWSSATNGWNQVGDESYYYYADSLCKNVIINMDSQRPVGADDTCVQWNFYNNAVVPKGDQVVLNGFRAQMNGKELIVEGTLTLGWNLYLTGSSDTATVDINGGSLIMPDTEYQMVDASIKNEGEGYVVACKNGGSFVWENKYAELYSPKGGISKALQGIEFEYEDTEDAVAIKGVPDYVKLAEGALNWNSTYKYLRYAPFDFENSEEIVRKGNIDYSLSHNPLMIIGKKVYAELTENQQLTIPTGKTLRICSVRDNDNAQSGFLMKAGSTIKLEENATLIVDGNLWGEGIIELSTGSRVVNNGSISAKSMSTVEGASVEGSGTLDLTE